MTVRAIWVSLLVVLPGVLVAAPTGFQDKRRVRQGTTLDWSFAAGPKAVLPREYDSRKAMYQLFVPSGYKNTEAWPLVLLVVPGDTPLEWRDWEAVCEKHDILFAVAFDAGNDCDPAQRLRTVCDVLDDVRREYQVSVDRTYVVGHGGGSITALRLATALPELFGGVLLINGDGEVSQREWLRLRLVERLSVALVSGEKEAIRAQLEKYRRPLLAKLGVRSKLWLANVAEGASASAETLSEAIVWLEADVRRRVEDSKEYGGVGLKLAEPALVRANKALKRPDTLFRAAAELEWIGERFTGTEQARKASETLASLREDANTQQRLTRLKEAEARKALVAEASVRENAGQINESLRAWQAATKLGAVADRKNAAEQVQRLMQVLAQTPYLGAVFAGETTIVRQVIPGGPAHRAGLRAGDKVVRFADVEVSTGAEVRKLLAARKVGDEVEVGVRRGKETLTRNLRVWSVPES